MFAPVPKQANDITGRRYGRLVVLGFAGRYILNGKPRGLIWLCRCDCGKEIKVRYSNIEHCAQTSCGCGREYWRKHGFASRSASKARAEYSIWKGIKKRCFDHNDPSWGRYGGRGITICNEWKDDFPAFFAHVGARPSSRHTLDRIRNDGNYEPGNVQWATRAEQNRNTRRNLLVTHLGVTRTVADWADDFGILRGTVYARIRAGWDPLDALLTPPLPNNRERLLRFRTQQPNPF